MTERVIIYNQMLPLELHVLLADLFSDQHLLCQADICCLCSNHIQLSSSDDEGSLFSLFPPLL